jgi:Beta-lactamase
MIDIDKFGKNIEQIVAPLSLGYSYVIYQNGNLAKFGNGGYAVFPSDKQSAFRRMNCASMSKTITAAAALKAIFINDMNGFGVTVNSSIFSFLPAAWRAKHGPNVPNMTFAQVLSHTAGLTGTQSEDGLTQDAVAQSVLLGDIFCPNPCKTNYRNVNYCLMRTIIPHMITPNPDVTLSLFDSFPAVLGSIYVKFAQEQVLKPCSVVDVSIHPTGVKPYTKYYDFNNPFATAHSENTDRLSTCGSTWWNIAADEYARFLVGLSTGKIFPTAFYNSMQSLQLGMFQYGATPAGGGQAVTYYGHNGRWDYSDGTGMQGAWMIFPNNIIAVLLINSDNGLNTLIFPQPGLPPLNPNQPLTDLTTTLPVLIIAHDGAITPTVFSVLGPSAQMTGPQGGLP